MALVSIAIGFNNLTGVQVLIGLGHDKLFLYSVLVGTFSNFVMNCCLIPFYGAEGAAIASVTAEFLILFVTYYFVKKKTPIHIDGYSDILKSFVGGILLCITSFVILKYIQGWGYVIVYVVLSTFVYLISQLMLKNNSLLLFKGIIFKKFKKQTV